MPSASDRWHLFDNESLQSLMDKRASAITQRLKKTVSTLTALVQTTQNLEEKPVATNTVPSPGSFSAPNTADIFLVHLLFAVFLYEDWKHPYKMFVSSAHLSVLHPFEEVFVKK